MPRFNLDLLPLNVDFRTAFTRLEAIPDEELVRRMSPNMFLPRPDRPELVANAWRAGEPEHDLLASAIRAQLNDDLRVAYLGDVDVCCDDLLTRVGPSYHRSLDIAPYGLLGALWDNDMDDGGDDYDELCRRYDATPLIRLRVLCICEAPPGTQDADTDELNVEDMAQQINVTRQRVAREYPIYTTTMASTNFTAGTTTMRTSPF